MVKRLILGLVFMQHFCAACGSEDIRRNSSLGAIPNSAVV
jgi:hypothetical protein